jgi:SNF2 family DNA or RNA helicase
MKPFETKTELMKHQAAAVEKVLPSRVGGLFMEMGTGKSRTAIEIVRQRIRKVDHVIWFCPVSLKETVRQEILKHTDCTDVYVFNDKTNADNIPAARWYVIGIESMSSSTRVVLTTKKLITDRTFIILDESSYIKGYRALRTDRIIFLSKEAKYRLILTGTPLSQGVVDLFSQMRFLSPLILGYTSFYSFAANHLEYSEKFPGKIVRAHNTQYLAAKIQPYVYQVTKKECLDLPQKLYETRYFYMSPEQREWYDTAKYELLPDILDDNTTPIDIFRLFTALQEVVSGFWNRRIKKGQYEHLIFPCKRTAILMEVVDDIPEDEKVIIFAKFQYDIDSIKAALEGKYGAGNIATFTGQLSEKNRQKEVSGFRKGTRFFLATQSCGGHGLTLNEAHHVIFYNNGFKYSERLQAEDRCHRIGQDHPVTYIDICCLDSIDTRIEAALSMKSSLVADFKRQVDKVKDNKVKIKELIKRL